MSEDVAIAGVFVHPLLVAACCAFVVAELLGWALARLGFYRLVWHRGLFDVALTIVLWGVLATLITGGSPSAALFG